MRALLVLMLLAAPAGAQTFGNNGYVLSGDLGLGVKYGPEYMGSDDQDASVWIILRNGSLTRQKADGRETTDGLSIVPSFNLIGSRDANDHDALRGMDDISRAGEIGFQVAYDQGPARGYIALRKGFGGHKGLVGEFGARYQYAATDRLTITPRAEAQFGSDDFTETYFGVTADESITSGYDAYAPGGGIYSAAIGVEARYAVTDTMAVLGEFRYTRLLGDAADSPIVQDKDQPSVRLGVVRRFSFGF